MVTVDDVRSFAGTLPRAYEVVVRGRLKFRVGRIVFLSFSHDETLMGFGFPKEWREALVESEPEKFMLPRASDLRYNWAVVRLDLERYHYLHATRGELLRRLGRADEPRAAYDRALDLVTAEPERRFLEQRLADLDTPSTR